MDARNRGSTKLPLKMKYRIEGGVVEETAIGGAAIIWGLASFLSKK
jgi:hypothetical protein